MIEEIIDSGRAMEKLLEFSDDPKVCEALND